MVLDYYAGGDLYHLITHEGALRPSLSRNLFQQLVRGSYFFQAKFLLSCNRSSVLPQTHDHSSRLEARESSVECRP